MLRKLESAIAGVWPDQKTPPVLSVGVGCPGPVDVEQGTAVEYPYIRDFHDVALVEPLAARFGIPVYIENTSNTMALAELWFGAGRELHNFVCIWIRSGVGAGLIVDRNLYRGVADGAGEIGHWRCPARDRNKGNGDAWRELQDTASVRAILRALHPDTETAPAAEPQVSDVLEACRRGDAQALDSIRAAAESLGWAVGHLGLVLAPEAVILAGPLTELGPVLSEPVGRIVQDLYAGWDLPIPKVLCSDLGPFSGALGAAALAVDRWKPAR
ncbi:MAG: ROK family protein [Lentisphaerae bacterium]|nr:ROK family protein [Lentisphaerota bacterium]